MEQNSAIYFLVARNDNSDFVNTMPLHTIYELNGCVDLFIENKSRSVEIIYVVMWFVKETKQ